MNTPDSLKSILANRFESVLNSRAENFRGEVNMFYDFIYSKDITKSIIEELESQKYDVTHTNDYIRLKKTFTDFKKPSDYVENIYFCNHMMKKIASGELDYFAFSAFSTNPHEMCRLMADNYLEPVYKYIIEKIENVEVFLYLLLKYKNKIEWFRREELYSLYNQDTLRGEDNLTKNFREYLHDQGIDYPFSTPESPRGRADLVTYFELAEPLALEVKLFNPEKGLNKEHVKQGIRQAYGYARDYGSANGYLLIFNLSNEELVFDGTEKAANYNKMEFPSKIIFIVVVNVTEIKKKASKEKEIKKYVIDVNKLVTEVN